MHKWSVSDSAVTVEEFFGSIEASAKIGRWEESDQREIAFLRLAGYFIRGAPKSLKRERRGKPLRMHLKVVQGYTYRSVTFYKSANSEAGTQCKSTGFCRSLSSARQKVMEKSDFP